MTCVILSSFSPNSKRSIIKQSPHPSRAPTSPVSNPHTKPFILPNLLSLALTLSLNSPSSSPALPSLGSLLATPFSQSQNLQVGLEDGKIRPCPSMNPRCVSTNPKSASIALPLTIPPNSSGNPLEKLQVAILRTQKNARIEASESTPEGGYVRAEVEGGWGREVMEFLVKGEAVGYRCVARGVSFIYPLTAPLGDSKGQEQRLMRVVDELGWYAPSFDSMD